MFVCECGKILKHQSTLSRHKKNCKIRKLEKVIKELEAEIEKLEAEIEKLKETQGNTIINNTNYYNSNNTTTIDNRKIEIEKMINNLQPLDESKFGEQLDYLELPFLKCPKILSKYIAENLLKDRVFCSDIRKQLCHFKDKKGNIIEDPKLKEVAEKVYVALISDGYTQDHSPQIHKESFKKKFVKHTCNSIGNL